jgi:tripartite-type tricarboxylate transporter receptor subunit TctC
MFDLMSSSLEYIRSGQLRALAVTTATRSDLLPDTPSIREFVPGYEAITIGGIGAPKGRPSRSSRSSTRKSMRVLPMQH